MDFKFFQKERVFSDYMDAMDDYFLGGFDPLNIPNQGQTYHMERQAPPYGISRRHWNLLPQDLKGGEREDMETYIEGWEAAGNANYNNPYHDIHTNRAEMWNRGWHAWWSRRNRRNGNNPYYEAVREEINNIFNDEPQTHGFTVGVHNTQIVLEYRGEADIESVRAMIYSLRFRYANYVSIGEQVLGFMEEYLNLHLSGTSTIRLS